jgi:hypothetical protein
MSAQGGYEVAREPRQEPVLESAVLAALTGWGSEGGPSMHD